MVKAFKQRHDYIVGALNELPGVSCLPSDGTFYCFPSFQGAQEALGLDTDVALAEHLIGSAGIALVPGSAFGAPGHMRISYATSMDALQSAIQRLQQHLPQSA